MKLYIINDGLYHQCIAFGTIIFDCVYSKFKNEFRCTKCQFRFPSIISLAYEPANRLTLSKFYYFTGKNINITFSEASFSRQEYTILEL